MTRKASRVPFSLLVVGIAAMTVGITIIAGGGFLLLFSGITAANRRRIRRVRRNSRPCPPDFLTSTSYSTRASGRSASFVSHRNL
jgi:hypothetical protein